MRDRKKLAAAGVAMLGTVLGVGATNAYLTSYDQMVNTIGVGKNTTTIEEKFPSPSPLPGDGDTEYSKTVWVANGSAQESGHLVDCYVRVSLGYSDEDIARAVSLNKVDQKNWVKAEDGFYYYKKILGEGERTTPLFSGITIDSSKIEKTYLDNIDAFEIQVYEESVQASGFEDYESAWRFYQT